MRLTLRTMLAYLDEQLEPPQMEEIGHKIRESGVASGMIDRVRTSMRKHRMEAPKLDARGIGKDANSVAEYLDNVLDKEEIPELEQLCLNSDMHLAEVAACHQILSLLPKVDFEIDSDLRDRIYDIPSRLQEREEAAKSDANVVRPKQTTVKTPAQDGGKKKRKKTPHVPEYFKAQEPASRSWLPLLFTAGVVLLGLGLTAFLTRDQWLKNFARQTSKNNPRNLEPVSSSSTEANSVAGKGADGDSNAKSPEKHTDADANTTAAHDEKMSASTTENEAETGNEATNEPVITEGVAPPPPPDETPAMPEESNPPPVTANSQTPTMIGGSPAVTWDTVMKGWRRINPNEPLPWESSVVLIGTRTDCKLLAGAHATIVGPSEVRFEKAATQQDATWVLDSGRIVFDAKDAGGTSLKAKLAGREVDFKFVSPDAQLAVEASRAIPAGADPANPDEYPVIVMLDILRGAVEVKVGGMGQLVEAGADTAVVEIDPSGALKKLAMRGAPLWVDEQTSSEVARQASKELTERLSDPKEVLSISLQELAADNRVNVASLASQALAQLGQIKPLCDQFRDVQYRLAWRTNHQFLKTLMQTSPASADMVRLQLDEHLSPEESAAIYRLLCGYTKDQFADEGRQLIAGLKSESSLHRVLAYQTLVDLVGPGGRKYQPEDPPNVRAKHFPAWVEAFDSGKLKVKD